MKYTLLTSTIILFTSCMSVPEGDFDKIIGADDPSFSRASLTCLQKPMNHQPHPNNEVGRYQTVSSDASCMESELTKIAVKRANNKDENKIQIYLKKKKGIVVVNSDENDFNFEKLEKLFKKKVINDDSDQGEE